MPVYSNVKSYLQQHQKPLFELLERVGVDTSKINTIVIPSKGDITKWSSEIDKYDPKEFDQLAVKLYCYLFSQNFNDQKVKMSGEVEVINRARQLCKIGKMSNGSFDLMSGEGLKTVAKCEIDSSFVPSKNFKDDGQKPICVVKTLSGEIATDGKISDYKDLKGAGEDSPADVGIFFGASEDIQKIRKVKCDNFKHLLSKGRHAFVECIAGLLVYLTKTELSEFDECKSVIASLLCYDACATYIVLVQPYGDNSFIPNRLYLDDWAFAPAHSSDYVKVFEDFVAAYGPKIDEEARKDGLKKARSMLSSVGMSLSFKDIYEQYVPKVYPSNFGLKASELLWAHEAEFKIIHSSDILEIMAEQFRGEDYHKESAYSSPDYIKMCSASGIFSSESLKRDNSPRGFVNSEYFLKYTLVNEPSCCKDELAKCSNPLDARARAFCLINS